MLFVKIHIVGGNHFLAYRIRSNNVNVSGTILFFGQVFFKFFRKGKNLMGIGDELMPTLGKGDGMIDSFKQ